MEGGHMDLASAAHVSIRNHQSSGLVLTKHFLLQVSVLETECPAVLVAMGQDWFLAWDCE